MPTVKRLSNAVELIPQLFKANNSLHRTQGSETRLRLHSDNHWGYPPCITSFLIVIHFYIRTIWAWKRRRGKPFTCRSTFKRHKTGTTKAKENIPSPTNPGHFVVGGVPHEKYCNGFHLTWEAFFQTSSDGIPQRRSHHGSFSPFILNLPPGAFPALLDLCRSPRSSSSSNANSSSCSPP